MSDLVSVSASKVGIGLFQMRYQATLTCSGHSPLTASTTGQGGRRMSVTFSGTSDWSAQCTIKDSSRIVGIHGVSTNVLWLIGGILVGLILVGLWSWRQRRQRHEETEWGDYDESDEVTEAHGASVFDDDALSEASEGDESDDDDDSESPSSRGLFAKKRYSPRHSVR